MRILFAIQGTGNGHISRAREIIPHLVEYGDLDVLISGTHSEIQVNHPILYQLHGMGFQFGKNGGIAVIDSLKVLRPFQFLKDMRALPIETYDLVINDFEPVSAYAAKKRGVPVHALSHQSAFLSPFTPRPKKQSTIAEWLFSHYAPSNASTAFHFKKYDHFISTPVIRTEVRQLQVKTLNHIAVYLPAYDANKLLLHFLKRKEVQWHLFSKHDKHERRVENVWIRPLNNANYLQSLAESSGLITGGGFEAPAEALYLGKKLLVIPMKNQYEQQCNAVALAELGVAVYPAVDMQFSKFLLHWLKSINPICIDYPNETPMLVKECLDIYK